MRGQEEKNSACACRAQPNSELADEGDLHACNVATKGPSALFFALRVLE
eukprot:CAMPEP_0116837792 /NCGR_PEP_ID=MMETSP0418-20121206/8851_1 /TAXON_ID=1158023 /ORGANISM="Astrosyne radiata, Strain 13vi08-1A" /LENGTH=48 /DNA_ID= /DNA_START= /DNA_END= /DNA_ORIENTATION=